MGDVSALSPEQREIIKELDACVCPEAQNFVANIRTDLRSGWDRFFLGTGKRGVGKTTLFCQLSKLVDYSFHFGRLAFAPDEIHPILLSMGQYEAMQMDEGAEILSRQDWMTTISKNLTKQLVGDRYLHSFRGVLAPNIYYFNQQLIEMADYWIKVESPDNRMRGFAEVRLISEIDYIKKKLPYAPAIYDLEFDDLPRWVAEEYQRVKAQKGKARSERYGREIKEKMYGKPKPWIAPDVVASEVKENPEKFMSDGKFDYRKIYSEYSSEGFGVRRCKDLAYLLNRKLDEGED